MSQNKTHETDTNDTNESKEELFDFHPLSFAWELGYTIAIPIILFALLGRLADAQFGTSPWLLLTGIFLSMLVSSFSVYIKAMKIISGNSEDVKSKDKN